MHFVWTSHTDNRASQPQQFGPKSVTPESQFHKEKSPDLNPTQHLEMGEQVYQCTI